ncbi:MAG: helix-turn-helix domain-containing protein [Varibaculum sp.]|nr:helix-turn-helix domain-containing protein [Varibaculum sp.]
MATQNTKAVLLGKRVRHARTSRGMTLTELAQLVDRAPSLLSQIENGKREARPELVTEIAKQLSVTLDYLFSAEAPTERDALEVELEANQNDPEFTRLGIPSVRPNAKLGTDVLRSIVSMQRELISRSTITAATPEEARRANRRLRERMRASDNYFPEIELQAADITERIGHLDGPLTERGVQEIAEDLGYRLRTVEDLPHGTRSVLDSRNRVLYYPTTSHNDKDPRMVVLRGLAAVVLGHKHPNNFEDFLTQRVESNYFAAALLMPERSAIQLLSAMKAARELNITDMRDHYGVRYETAAHRFTNLATRHLGIPVHFSRISKDGVIYKAYSNDGIVFPTDPSGAIEGQIACKYWAARQVFTQSDPFAYYSQYTDTPSGTFYCNAQVITTTQGLFAVSVGVPFQESKWFRGRQTRSRCQSACPDSSCCRTPPPGLQERWETYAFPEVKVHSHLLAAIPPGVYLGMDATEVYEFLDRHNGD